MLPLELGCGSGVTGWLRLRDWQEVGVWPGYTMNCYVGCVMLTDANVHDSLPFEELTHAISAIA